MHCLVKPEGEEHDVFKEKVTKFVSEHIEQDDWGPFIRRIQELGATQTLSSQQDAPKEDDVDYFDNLEGFDFDGHPDDYLNEVDEDVDTFSQNVSETVSQPMVPDDDSATGVINPEDVLIEEEDTDDNRVVVEEDSGQSSNQSSQSSQNSIPLYQPGPNQYCRAFRKGQCQRGSNCPYPHNEPNSNKGDGGRGICSAFQRGYCARGDDCRFSHEGGSVRTTKRRRTTTKRKRTNKKRINKKRTLKKVKHFYKKTRNRK